jgi:CRISPR/Cas system-associated exonuclease Cas4 (RecB family)
MIQTWDVRELLDEARRLRREEDTWVAEHKGALAASQLGGCLRREKLRLMGTPETNPPTPAQLRRWRWGNNYQEEVYQNAIKAGRRPNKAARVEIECEGIVIRGIPDLVFTEGVLEIKTTSAWEMDAQYLPFSHLMQLGAYMHGLQRPGQLLYASFQKEWSFDFPSLPGIFQPYVQEVARLFAEHTEDDPRPFPPERMYCHSCPYLQSCPTEESVIADTAVNALEEQIIEAYLKVRAEASAAAKREDEAKAKVLGLREQRGMDDKGITCLRLPRRTVIIQQRAEERIDYSGLDQKIKEALPHKTIIKTIIKEVLE